MKKILVLGASGMLGHKAYQVLSKEFDVYAAFRNYSPEIAALNIFANEKVVSGIDAENFDTVAKLLKELKPDFVINCIGIVKQIKEANDHILSIYINSLFPHLLNRECLSVNAKLIHISTDCVYSGKKGNYNEADEADANDLYGRSKRLGELNLVTSLTIRTSIIGHELFTNHSLVDWFLTGTGNTVVQGYVNAIFSGFPTVVFCNELARIIRLHPELNSIHHVATNPISKYELLKLINRIYDAKKIVEPYEAFICDRSLNPERYVYFSEFVPQDWETMIRLMHEDYLNTNYPKK